MGNILLYMCRRQNLTDAEATAASIASLAGICMLAEINERVSKGVTRLSAESHGRQLYTWLTKGYADALAHRLTMLIK